jgi:hypothetical protein
MRHAMESQARFEMSLFEHFGLFRQNRLMYCGWDSNDGVKVAGQKKTTIQVTNLKIREMYSSIGTCQALKIPIKTTPSQEELAWASYAPHASGGQVCITDRV